MIGRPHGRRRQQHQAPSNTPQAGGGEHGRGIGRARTGPAPSERRRALQADDVRISARLHVEGQSLARAELSDEQVHVRIHLDRGRFPLGCVRVAGQVLPPVGEKGKG